MFRSDGGRLRAGPDAWREPAGVVDRGSSGQELLDWSEDEGPRTDSGDDVSLQQVWLSGVFCVAELTASLR